MIKYVPTQLIQYALTNKMASEFRTFLFLKNYSKNGITTISTNSRIEIETGLCISRRTLERHLNTLINFRWINVDIHERYFIRGWESLKRICRIQYLSKVEFHIEYISKDNYIGYFMGTVIAYQCRLKRVKEWKERKLGRSKQPPLELYPISISYLSNLIRIPESTVRTYKLKAIQRKFVFRKKNKIKYGRKLKDVNLNELRLAWGDEPSYPILINKIIYLILPDSFNSSLHFKKY